MSVERKHEDNGQTPAEKESSAQTPLQLVKEQQAMLRESQEVSEQGSDSSPEVPGASSPSNRRKHPQRQMYGDGKNEA